MFISRLGSASHLTAGTLLIDSSAVNVQTARIFTCVVVHVGESSCPDLLISIVMSSPRGLINLRVRDHL